MKDLIEVGLAVLIAVLLVILTLGLIVAGWLLFGIFFSWTWNTILIEWFPDLPVITTVQAAIVGFMVNLITRLVYPSKAS